MNMNSYVLVTPVRDEEKLLPLTITSVVSQTVLPAEWMIVSDGSTDGTNDIVREASAKYPWIRLLEIDPRPVRCFAAVVHATEAGISHLKTNDYVFLGLQDSDVTFQTDYYEKLIQRFLLDPLLGLIGGVVIDVGMPRNRYPRNLRDVPGAVQFFRRQCFEKIGGLIPIPEGGWDAVTCAMARMNGYHTRLYTDLVVDHLKPRNISQGGAVRRKWQMGLRDHALGYHPMFEALKCAGRITHPPFIVGALAWSIGYCMAFLQRRPRIIGKALVKHIRTEQMRRLRAAILPTRNRPPSHQQDPVSDS